MWSKKPRGPRRMQVILPHVLPSGETVESRPMTEDGGSPAAGCGASRNLLALCASGVVYVKQYQALCC